MYIVTYRRPEQAIEIHEFSFAARLIKTLGEWQEEIIRHRVFYGLPDAQLSFVQPNDREIGVGKDGASWPAWTAMIVSDQGIVVPQPAEVVKGYQL